MCAMLEKLSDLHSMMVTVTLYFVSCSSKEGKPCKLLLNGNKAPDFHASILRHYLLERCRFL